MLSSDLILKQRQKELRILKTFLLCSLVGSLGLHAVALTLRVGSLWEPLVPTVDDRELEIVVDEVVEEEIQPEEMAINEPEPEPEPEPEVEPEVAFAPELAPPPLAPESQAPLPVGEDAPADESLTPEADPVTPLISETGDAETPTETAKGPITKENGTGSGFGTNDKPTGFVPGGKPDGKPEGKPGGTPEGEGTKKRETTAINAPPPSPQPAKPKPSGGPVCLRCPKPKYQGKEGAPRVTYDIAPDGRVVNVRLRKTSGDPKSDREALEAISQWRFDPKSVDGGRDNVRVRVTFEEEGSRYQRENGQRRQDVEQQREAERQRVAEQEQRQREAMQQAPPATAIEPPTQPETGTPAQPASTDAAPSAPIETPVAAPVLPAANPAPAPASAPVYEPAPAPVYEPAPAPVYEPLPEPVYEPPPAPVYEPPPEPVYEPAPAPLDAPPPDGT